ncbi:MAG: NADH-quinone oxidoreductase subunit L [Alphaproteobacteria bacterium]|nr:NADH-quinone oxidoreductase subunit L [Alphaproteobacteria bacterium]MDE2111734.1 NADH-quinone oxidoreductase subunit L [Alphaproteobacteria bacterium]MDE2494899.1 NADH-quinone oxidoreductase subunit L [Alphaproteobacteria bacterium]
MYTAIVFLPIVASAIAGLFGRFLGARLCEILTTVALFASCALSIVAFYDVAILGHSQIVMLWQWITSGDFEVDWMIRVDTLTAVMLVVVTGVSSLVHLYSIGYMHDDPGRPRFFSYLSFFTFAMLMLVTANNFLQLFFGWEGVGLASYLLIGFWYKKPSANAAAIKAFVVNRVGDFGFALGIFGVFYIFKTLNFDAVFAAAPAMAGKTFLFAGHNVDILTTLCLLLFVGAMGKSAQLGLHTWLPDAMEGPTPVSALIHAATMVTAGVFLVCRCSPMFEHAPDALAVVAIIGASTAFFAATIGLFQNDIKRVIAYSTCSQLGYMFAAAGVSAYGAAMFHLFTHAFFKALLFLAAGSVIVAMHHEQDMRKMGGLAKRLPFTWLTMLIGNLALTGFGIPLLGIGTAGFYSKDSIINAAYLAGTPVGQYAFALTAIAALLTSFYSWRQFLMTFHGKFRGGEGHHGHGHGVKLEDVHESPLTMLIPLGVLATGALIAGAIFAHDFIGVDSAGFWRDAVAVAYGHGGGKEIPLWVELTPFVFTLLGFGVAYYYYIMNPELPAKMAARKGLIYTFVYNKWYFDELYDFLFVQPALKFGRFLWKFGDGTIIDGLGPDGIAARVLVTTRSAVKLQSGYVYHYAFAMLIGVFVLATFFVVTGGMP